MQSVVTCRTGGYRSAADFSGWREHVALAARPPGGASGLPARPRWPPLRAAEEEHRRRSANH